jgi:RNA polymerase sigma factor (sigma-70 family)
MGRTDLSGLSEWRQSRDEMNAATTTPDRDLVRSYAREGSETAFRALVGRHVNLVFATAYRQVGDTGLAEEITQNVFVSLARKAPRLAGHETIAGWLHRSAILESKARFRAEMRRRRREEVAAALAESQSPGRDPVEDLSPLLDEALLQLRENDRLALVLRFLEERSLREVGSVLGIDEDAARKRVTRALARVAEFFRSRGFALPATGGAALIGQAAKAAPAGLAAAASSAGLAAGGTTSGLGLVLLQLMSLTKTQTTLVCGLLIAAPLAWQSAALGNARRDAASLQRELSELSTQRTGAEEELTRLGNSLLQARNETAGVRARMARQGEQRPQATPAPTAPSSYRWDDNSPLVRIPKDMLAGIDVQGNANQRGELSPEIRGILQLTDGETRNVQSAIDRFFEAYQKVLTKTARPVEPTPQELQGFPRDQVLAFEFQGLEEPARALRDELFADLGAALDADRLKLLRASLEGWMGASDEEYGLRSSQAIRFIDHRFRVTNLGDPLLLEPEQRLGFGIAIPNRGSFNANQPAADLPDFVRPLVQPWLDAARQNTPTQPPSPSNPATPASSASQTSPATPATPATP